MDLDLRLMRQLLILNEEIEDLKWRRRHAWGDNCASSQDGSYDMMQSAASLSNKLEMQPALKFSTPSSLSLQLEGDEAARFSVYDDDDHTNTFNRGKRHEQATVKIPCTAAGGASTSSTLPDHAKLISHRNSNSQYKASRTEDSGIVETQNTEPVLSGSNEKNIGVQGLGCNNTTAAMLKSQNKLVRSKKIQSNNSIPVFVNGGNKKSPRNSKKFSHDKGNGNLKTSNLCPSGCSTSHQSTSGNPKRLDAAQSLSIATNFCQTSSKASPCFPSPNSTRTAHVFKSGAKTSSRKTHSPRGAETCTTTIHGGTRAPDVCSITASDTSSKTSAIAKPKQTDKLMATHKAGCSSTSLSANDQIPLSLPGHNPGPAPWHRRKTRTKVTTVVNINARRMPISGVPRPLPRKKTKEPNKVLNGDAESHDSGINDIFN
ncbi:hypothetical protein ElyMa_003431200 [Elysia marginata]|uniref:Uncharacterized protein n=1 Tax=Elysia marginata TaxID=1093978 RepID=A0AAV4JWR6_9GAST|nr:hypothetical protein ElyMa_003431200 [Elysia marginata]